MEKITIKQYEYKKIEIESKEIILPSKTTYYFEYSIRRSIRVTPIYFEYNDIKQLVELSITCVYNCYEYRIEKFSIGVSQIEEIYYSEKHIYKDFITGLIENWFREREEEDFNKDFEIVLNKIKE